MINALMFSVITDTTQIHTGTTRGCVSSSYCNSLSKIYIRKTLYTKHENIKK
jgi:hypothetical protein